MRGVRGWISVSKNVGLEGLYGRVSHGLEGSQLVGDHHDVMVYRPTILDVATIILN